MCGSQEILSTRISNETCSKRVIVSNTCANVVMKRKTERFVSSRWKEKF